MSFVISALKWRPDIFSEVVGQEHISQTLKNAIKNGRIAHGYIFAGPRGVGKTTTARIFAKALNCENLIDGEPCNKCKNCTSYNNQQNLDIIEIDGASNRKIDDIRQLRENIRYAPSNGKYKIYIIDEVHMLTTESFNAFLKTLEEPPAHVVFIFATTDVHKVPLTILSRCQRFDFRRIDLPTAKLQLKKIADEDGIVIDDESLTLIARKADGALRDAESLFDQVVSFSGKTITALDVTQMFNLIDDEVFFEISDSILNKNFRSAFEISQKIYDNGWNFVDLFNGMQEHFRNILSVIISGDGDLLETSKNYVERYLAYKNQFSESDLLRIMTLIGKIQYEIKTATNPKLKTEVTLVQIIGLEKSSSISELLKKISDPNFTINIQESNANENLQSVVNGTNSSNYASVQNIKKEEIPTEEHISIPHFDEIQKNWDKFVEETSRINIKVGSSLINSKPLNMDGNILKIALGEGISIQQKMGKDSGCGKAINSFFNSDFKIELLEGRIKSIENETQSDLEKAIIAKLGGKEIKRY